MKNSFPTIMKINENTNNLENFANEIDQDVIKNFEDFKGNYHTKLNYFEWQSIIEKVNLYFTKLTLPV